ncbi:hypothetical protein [Amycolatopsis sp. NPDC059021]|uniref:hypothetical protein n=1 Tax=Amycolatopsis sp. NPDC059021 TaxID=3346704 RepID=UPI0036716F27
MAERRVSRARRAPDPVPDHDPPRRSAANPWVWTALAGGVAIGALSVGLFGGGFGDRPVSTTIAAPPVPPAAPVPGPRLGDNDLGDIDDGTEPGTPEPPVAPPPAPVVQQPVAEVVPQMADAVPPPPRSEAGTAVQTVAEPVVKAAEEVVTPILATVSEPVSAALEVPEPPSRQDTAVLALPEAGGRAADPPEPMAVSMAVPMSAGRPVEEDRRRDTGKHGKPQGNQDRPKANKNPPWAEPKGASRIFVVPQPDRRADIATVLPEPGPRPGDGVRPDHRHGQRLLGGHVG